MGNCWCLLLPPPDKFTLLSLMTSLSLSSPSPSPFPFLSGAWYMCVYVCGGVYVNVCDSVVLVRLLTVPTPYSASTPSKEDKLPLPTSQTARVCEAEVYRNKRTLISREYLKPLSRVQLGCRRKP